MLGKPSTFSVRALGKALRLPSALLILATGSLYTANFPAQADPGAVPAVASPETTATAVPAVFSRAQGLSPKVLAKALDAVAAARAQGISGDRDKLTIIDYSLPSTQPRLWVLDLAQGKVLFHEMVAHGSGSGDKYATRFSNVNDSRATSLGLFLTGGTYEGGNGYSLKLKGLDAGINDRAEERHIVVHGAWYVSDDHARQFGMIGRSWGCPALPLTEAPAVIDAIKGGTFLYAYANGAMAPSIPTMATAYPPSHKVAKGTSRTARAMARKASRPAARKAVRRSAPSRAPMPVSRTR
jgi:hypothetical protein